MSRMDEQIKKGYDGASPEELMSSFDKEALWGQVQAGLQKPSPVKILLRKVVYAAAAVAAVLALLFWLPADHRQEQLSALRTVVTPVAPVVDPAPDTLNREALVKTFSPAKQASPDLASGTENKPAPQRDVPVDMPTKQEPLAVVVEDRIMPATIAATSLPVRHLLDLGNEDRDLIDNGNLPQGPGQRIIELNKPGGTNGGQPALAFRQIFARSND